ncbi:MAG: aminotransferase class I/II-fold pyridoxal phosphate-dependent enzyme [Micrococcales bacterium]|nr:aminotransferase class I/II-fold pyridoxal phosphate-dependent enzyme [Micrococcales bacterium]
MSSRILTGDLAFWQVRRTSVKWRVFDDDVLPAWVAEMDAQPCEPVMAAVTEAVRRGDTGYPMQERYAAALRGFAARRWGWQVDPGAMTMVADVMVGCSELLRLLTDDGGPVIVSPPCYDSFHGFVTALGRRAVHAPGGADGRLDLTALDRAFGEARAGGERAAYLLSNPQNPTGVAHTRDELASLARLAAEHGVRVVSDEIHAPLVYAEAAFTPYLVADETGLGYAVHSPSKAWNLAGLKAALVIAGERAREEGPLLHEVHTHGASHIGAIAHASAYADGEPWLDQLLGELDANRRRVAEVLAEQAHAVGYRVPEATYLAWLDFRATPIAQDPFRALLDRGRVALSAGRSYDPEGGQGFARLNFATSPELLDEALERIVATLA